MFTGIVEEMGVVKQAKPRLTIEASMILEDVKVSDSVAVNGVCLTVTFVNASGFSVDVMPETVRRSNLGMLHYNDRVNIERALVMGGRLGGHLLSGHADDTGKVIEVTPEGDAHIMRISAPAEIMAYVVEKGFIGVDGASLTVAGFDGFSFTVSLVGYTLKNTTLGEKKPGDIVNLEADIIAKYVRKFSERGDRDLMLDFLK
ncbi:MAG: riboflavin synthase [Dehalococcoidia bacterium]|nr:riboflavin synthase [Dehalococcoidia bacterium]